MYNKGNIRGGKWIALRVLEGDAWEKVGTI